MLPAPLLPYPRRLYPFLSLLPHLNSPHLPWTACPARWVVCGCPLASINRILERGLRAFRGLTCLEVGREARTWHCRIKHPSGGPRRATRKGIALRQCVSVQVNRIGACRYAACLPVENDPNPTPCEDTVAMGHRLPAWPPRPADERVRPARRHVGGGGPRHQATQAPGQGGGQRVGVGKATPGGGLSEYVRGSLDRKGLCQQRQSQLQRQGRCGR